MTIIDVNAFLGRFPFRDVGEWGPDTLLAEMDRVGIDEAWVSHFDGIFDPMSGNASRALAPLAKAARLKPVYSIHPWRTGWEHDIALAVAGGAVALRVDPLAHNILPTSAPMFALAEHAAHAGLPLVMTARLEDVRQRDAADRSGDLGAADLRPLVRAVPNLRMLVTHASRDVIEQVHFSLTPTEASRVLWDITLLWGPPENDLALLLETVGLERFAFGGGIPLRIPESSIAKLDLLELASHQRERIASENVRQFIAEARLGR